MASIDPKRITFRTVLIFVKRKKGRAGRCGLESCHGGAPRSQSFQHNDVVCSVYGWETNSLWTTALASKKVINIVFTFGHSCFFRFWGQRGVLLGALKFCFWSYSKDHVSSPVMTSKYDVQFPLVREVQSRQSHGDFSDRRQQLGNQLDYNCFGNVESFCNHPDTQPPS